MTVSKRAVVEAWNCSQEKWEEQKSLINYKMLVKKTIY